MNLFSKSSIIFLSLISQLAFSGDVYKCKLSNGKLAYQDSPCVSTKTEEKTQSTYKSIVEDKEPNYSEIIKQEADLLKAKHNKCLALGKSVFDGSLEQAMQQPQSAVTLCKKQATENMKSYDMCIRACLESWYDEYKKKYLTPTK